MKSPPAGWPRISSCVFYDDPQAAIDWLCQAFGFEVRLKVEGDNGEIVHSELELAEGLIMVGGTGRSDAGKEAYQAKQASPKGHGGINTQSMCVHIDDVDAHCAHARKSGGVINREPATDDYGEDYWADRTYGCVDPEGHQWWFIQRMRTGEPKGA
jgi:uncharacterized glyoxalase superfamily protein PhnB